MSYGLLICSKCGREVHQSSMSGGIAVKSYWYHCDDKSTICAGASRAAPHTREDIKGNFCGADDFDGVFAKAKR